MKPALEKSMPHDLDAERALLGSILLDNNCLRALGSFEANDFFSDRHRIIYAAILLLRRQNKGIDLVTLMSELTRAGTLENVGGAGYLASLSDGVPQGDFSFVANYADIVQKKSEKRKLVVAAQNVIARAMNGEEDVRSIAGVLGKEFTAIVSRGAPAVMVDPEEDSETKPEGDISEAPDAPAECWQGLLEEYRSIVGPSCESSDNYHLMCCLAVVGAALGRSCYSLKGGRHYGNTFTILVGESNWSGKSQAMDRSLKLAEEAQLNVILASDISSGEGLLEVMNANIQADESKRRAGTLVHIDEFYSTLKKSQYQGSTIIPVLKKAFNTPTVLELVRHDKFKIVNPPTVTLLAGSEPEDLSESISSKDLKGGLGNRMDFTAGVPKPLNPHGYMPVFGEFAEKLGALIHFRHEAGGLDGRPFKFTPKADLMWDSFYRTLRKRGGQDATVHNLVSRHRVYVQRWALIYAGLDHRSVEYIEEDHLAPALALAKWRLESLFHIFKGVGKKEWVQDEIKIVGYVRRQGGRVEFRKLRRRFDDLGAEQLERYLKSLCSDPKQPHTPQDRDLRWEYVTNPSTGRETRFLCLNK